MVMYNLPVQRSYCKHNSTSYIYLGVFAESTFSHTHCVMLATPIEFRSRRSGRVVECDGLENR